MILVREEMCPQNHPCPVIGVCPVNAIIQEGFDAPKVVDDQCICCCKCAKSCSVFVPIGCCGEGRDRRMI